MHAENFFAALHIGQADRDLPIKTAGPQQCWIQYIGPIGCCDDDHAFLGVEAVHLDEQRVQCLLALVMTAAESVSAMTAHGIDLVDENEAWRRLLTLLEHVANT